MRVFFRGAFPALTCLVLWAAASEPAAASWRDGVYRATLRNDAIEAEFQAGVLCLLRDVVTGEVLLQTDPASLPAKLPVLGPHSLDVDTCEVEQTVTDNELWVRVSSPEGIVWETTWRAEQGRGDLSLTSRVSSPHPIEEIRVVIPGADIKDRRLVWLHGYGTGNVARAPQQGAIAVGNPYADGSPWGFPHPLVALFEGDSDGWFVEGRDPRVGPACLMIVGKGECADLGFVRRFPFPANSAEMYEIRIRVYHSSWTDAVDPYVAWLEDGAGFAALDKLPESQAWVAKLRTQAYIGVGDYRGLEELAKRVDPRETFVGRQAEFRAHGFDKGYPDYRVRDDAKQWARRARDLGFHLGMHFNIGSVSVMFPDLIERFKPGFQPTGTDAAGNETYAHIYEGDSRLYRVSAALKEWRDHLVEQIGHAVDAGIDVIYLDEAMAPHGRPVVGDTDGYQGVFLLMKEILDRYPHVAIETEQFNLLTAKYGKIALSQMPLGHPLSGHIFSKFVKVVPEGVMYSPTDGALMDAFDSWGFMLPGADTAREGSWMDIAEAFHRYKLTPDISLPHDRITDYAKHYTGGILPANHSADEAGTKLFGLRGLDGVTAYFEKHPNKRGLVVYEPGGQPRWFGTRHSGLRSYPGPGVPAYYAFRQQITDWLIYDGDTLLGLDPRETYWFDETARTSPTRFHVFMVPENYAGVTDNETRTFTQVIGKEDTYFIIRFTGRGEVGVYVPEGYDAYLDGGRLQPDPITRRATAAVNASLDKAETLGYHIELAEDADSDDDIPAGGPAEIIAFRRSDTELRGYWTSLPWIGSPDSLMWFRMDGDHGLTMASGLVGRISGKVPAARSVRLAGHFRVHDVGTYVAPDGVLRVNGTEILRLQSKSPPFSDTPFDVDLSAYAGQYVLFEFGSDGNPGRGGSVTWKEPQFVVSD